MQSKAATVEEYLESLPADRRTAVEAVLAVMRKNLDPKFSEGMSYGMIGWSVPHTVYPAGYHCDPKQPLPFAGLASQKNHLSLYLMSLYEGQEEEREFRERWAQSGKKLDMGKCCIRFKKVEDLALDLIGKTVKRTTVKKYVARYEAQLLAAKQAKAARKKK